MSVELEQRTVRLEVEVQVILEILNQAATLQKESNQTMTELTRRVNQLSDNVSYLAESLTKRSYAREKPKQGNFSGKSHYYDSNGANYNAGRMSDNTGRMNDIEMKDHLASMMRKLDNLTQQFEVLQSRELS